MLILILALADMAAVNLIPLSNVDTFSLEVELKGEEYDTSMVTSRSWILVLFYPVCERSNHLVHTYPYFVLLLRGGGLTNFTRI